jgi:hypothetical protein
VPTVSDEPEIGIRVLPPLIVPFPKVVLPPVSVTEPVGVGPPPAEVTVTVTVDVPAVVMLFGFGDTVTSGVNLDAKFAVIETVVVAVILPVAVSEAVTVAV